jgi:hypothetical protein
VVRRPDARDEQALGQRARRHVVDVTATNAALQRRIDAARAFADTAARDHLSENLPI